MSNLCNTSKHIPCMWKPGNEPDSGVKLVHWSNHTYIICNKLKNNLGKIIHALKKLTEPGECLQLDVTSSILSQSLLGDTVFLPHTLPSHHHIALGGSRSGCGAEGTTQGARSKRRAIGETPAAGWLRPPWLLHMMTQQCVVQGEYAPYVCVCRLTMMVLRSADSARWEL